MVDSQELDQLGARWESACNQSAAAKKYLFELVAKHNLNEHDPLWSQSPSDSSGTQYLGTMTREEMMAFEAMGEAERQAWNQKQVQQYEADRQENQAALPPEVRTALVRLNELKGAEFVITRKLAKKMFQRGMIGLIADRLGLQEDSEVEAYLDIGKP